MTQRTATAQVDSRAETAPVRRLVVHVGLQKTGSTAFQAFLARNREAMENTLVSYLPEDGGLGAAIGRRAMRYSETRAPQDLAAFRALFEQIAATVTDVPILVSNENLLGSSMGRGDVRNLYPELETLVLTMREALAPADPLFVLCLRDEQKWKRSLHNQVVRTDLYEGTLEDFLQTTEGCGDWSALVARLEQAAGPGNLVICHMEDEPDPKRYPGSLILKAAGVAEEDIADLDPSEDYANESLNAAALEFLRRANGLEISRKARRQVSKLVVELADLFDENADPVNRKTQGDRS